MMVSEHNMQRLKGGIDVFCDCFVGNPIDPKAVIKKDLDLDERDRVLSLRFSEALKRKPDEKVNSMIEPDKKVFYEVSTKTYPWTQETKRVVGYYAYKDLAHRVAMMVSEHNTQRLKGGIDVLCDCYVGNPIDPKVVVKKDLDLDERDRILSLRFKEGPIRITKRKIDFIDDDPFPAFKRLNNRQVPERCLTDRFNAKLAGQNFTQGARSARTYAQEKYGQEYGSITFSFQGTGICPTSAGPQELDPIIPQAITLIVEKRDGQTAFKNIGFVLPEKESLASLKTAEEIDTEIRILIDQAFAALNSL